MDREKTLDFNEKNIAEFRANDGKLESFGDAPLLLLTTTGAQSGKRRTSPMMYRDNPAVPGHVYVFASAAGEDDNPSWFNNLVAHPDGVGVEIGNDAKVATARILPEADRARVYAEQADEYPGFAGYQEKTSRAIPVIELELRDA